MKTLSSLLSFMLLALLSINSCASEQKPTANILVFGDSLSAGYGLSIEQDWPFLLQQSLEEQSPNEWQVINLSISGETTQGGLLRFPKAIEQYQPKIVILELGANDGLRGQSLKVMKNNLAQMIEQSQSIGASVLLAGMHIPPNYGRRYTQAFHKTYSQLQEKYDTNLIPFLLDDVAAQKTLMQKDGLHPNAQGQQRILKNVWKYLTPILHRFKENVSLDKS